jgi:hypothetical protein
MCSNIPVSPAYGVYISQLIRFARASSNFLLTSLPLYIFTIWKSIVYYRLCRDGIYFDKILVSEYKLLKRSNNANLFIALSIILDLQNFFHWYILQSWKLKRPLIQLRPHHVWTYTSNLTTVVNSVLKFMINGTTHMSIKINRLEEGHNSYPLVCRRPPETVSLQRRQICYRWGTPAYWSLVLGVACFTLWNCLLA